MPVKYKMEITSSMAEDVKYFEKLKMKIVDEGVEITALSPLFGKYFADRAIKTPATGRPSTFKGTGLWKNAMFFNVPQPLPHDIPAFIRPELTSLFWDGSPNLQWILHTDLANGFTMVVPEAMSLNNFEDYFMGCSVAIQQFHQMVLRRGELEATFSFREEEG